MPGLAPGKAGVRQLFEMFHAAFDHAGLAVDDMIAEGDKVFVMARMTGTQRYFRVDDGALTEHWGIMDAAGMMRQLTAR